MIMKAQYIKIDESGNKFYYLDQEMKNLHREDGPAVEWSSGSKSWWVNGKCHREDGPAVEWCEGYKEWHVDGEQLTEEQFNALFATVELTMEQIAAKFGIDVSKLKIVK